MKWFSDVHDRCFDVVCGMDLDVVVAAIAAVVLMVVGRASDYADQWQQIAKKYISKRFKGLLEYITNMYPTAFMEPNPDSYRHLQTAAVNILTDISCISYRCAQKIM